MPQAIPFILLATAVAGVGASVYGTMQQKSASEKQNQYNQQVLKQEQDAAAVQKQQADLESQRYRMQVIRQQNVQRSLALSNATAGGAQYGSGLQGGYGQISGESNTGLVNSFQNQGIANSLYGINQGISNTRYAQYGAMNQYYSGAAMTSLGGELVSSMGAIGRLSSGFGSGPGYGDMTGNRRGSVFG